jgi:hypothetical protein
METSMLGMKQHRDPVTGDTLTPAEYMSWIIQGIIRRWTFLGIITAITIFVWTMNSAIALTWWNLGASYLALVIESVVGIAMFSQTRRDALVLREVRAMGKAQEQLLERLDALLQREEKEIEEDVVEHLDKQDHLILQILEHLDRMASVENNITGKR